MTAVDSVVHDKHKAETRPFFWRYTGQPLLAGPTVMILFQQILTGYIPLMTTSNIPKQKM